MSDVLVSCGVKNMLAALKAPTARRILARCPQSRRCANTAQRHSAGSGSKFRQ